MSKKGLNTMTKDKSKGAKSSGLPWIPIHVTNQLAETNDLTAAELGIVLTLKFLLWRREDTALINDMDIIMDSLARCMTLRGIRSTALPRLLKRFFVLGSDNKWRHEEISAE